MKLGRIEAARRWVELRIGELLGPGVVGLNQYDEGSPAGEGSLGRHERFKFRRMAAHCELVEQAMAQEPRRRAFADPRATSAADFGARAGKRRTVAILACSLRGRTAIEPARRRQSTAYPLRANRR